VVDILDALDFFNTGLYDAGNYNSPPGASGIAAVPEPSTATLTALAVAGWVAIGQARRMRSCSRSKR